LSFFFPLLLMFSSTHLLYFLSFFFFTDTATTEIYTLSLHDALPIFAGLERLGQVVVGAHFQADDAVHRVAARGQHQHRGVDAMEDRKSTRLNSSHVAISYAVFCLKKKKE